MRRDTHAHTARRRGDASSAMRNPDERSECGPEVQVERLAKGERSSLRGR